MNGPTVPARPPSAAPRRNAHRAHPARRSAGRPGRAPLCAALRAAVLIVCAVCLIAVPGCSRRRSYPAPDDAFYVYDGAGVLSEENERYIAAAGADLYEKTGAQIVVVTVDTTGTEDIADYAEGLFNEWGVGSSDKNNGVLLLISVGEDDYWTVQGSGLEDLLSSGMLKLMLNEHMEPKFAAGDYDGAARSMFDALLAFFETAYQVSVETAAQTAEPQQGGASPDGEGTHGGDGGRTSILGPAFRTVAITVAVIALILFLVIGAGVAAAAILFLRSAKNSPDPGPEAAQKENRNPYSQTYRGPREGYRPEPTASATGKNPYTGHTDGLTPVGGYRYTTSGGTVYSGSPKDGQRTSDSADARMHGFHTDIDPELEKVLTMFAGTVINMAVNGVFTAGLKHLTGSGSVSSAGTGSSGSRSGSSYGRTAGSGGKTTSGGTPKASSSGRTGTINVGGWTPSAGGSSHTVRSGRNHSGYTGTRSGTFTGSFGGGSSGGRGFGSGGSSGRTSGHSGGGGRTRGGGAGRR